MKVQLRNQIYFTGRFAAPWLSYLCGLDFLSNFDSVDSPLVLCFQRDTCYSILPLSSTFLSAHKLSYMGQILKFIMAIVINGLNIVLKKATCFSRFSRCFGCLTPPTLLQSFQRQWVIYVLAVLYKQNGSPIPSEDAQRTKWRKHIADCTISTYLAVNYSIQPFKLIDNEPGEIGSKGAHTEKSEQVKYKSVEGIL